MGYDVSVKGFELTPDQARMLSNYYQALYRYLGGQEEIEVLGIKVKLIDLAVNTHTLCCDMGIPDKYIDEVEAACTEGRAARVEAYMFEPPKKDQEV